MSVRTWRIVKRKYAKTAFLGEGARIFGGRWNSPGFPVVYTAESQSLATLEILVHLESFDLLRRYVVAKVEIDESLISELDSSRLPRGWRADPSPAKNRAIGDNWLKSGASAVLQAPSAIIPAERTFLLNPRHRDFSRLRFGTFSAFRFDSRLTERR